MRYRTTGNLLSSPKYVAVFVSKFDDCEADECSNVQSRLGSNNKCHYLQF